MSHNDVVKFPLEKGAMLDHENERGESAAEVMSSEWTEELAAFYSRIANAAGVKIDLDQMESRRSEMTRLLREHE